MVAGDLKFGLPFAHSWGMVCEMNKEVIEKLLLVQDCDSCANKLERELKLIPEYRQKWLRKLRELENQAMESKKELNHLEVDLRKTALDVETKQAQLTKLKIQQMSTKKNDEYQAFIREIGNTEEQIDGLETRELELMELIDVAKAAHAERVKSLTVVRTDTEQELARFDAAAEKDRIELAALQSKRVTLADGVDEDLLHIYTRMAKSKGLPVVVRMTDEGKCTGCHTIVPEAQKHTVLVGREMSHCSNCSRILF